MSEFCAIVDVGLVRRRDKRIYVNLLEPTGLNNKYHEVFSKLHNISTLIRLEEHCASKPSQHEISKLD